MNNGSFDGGLLNLTNWVGNAVMPVLAALILALGVYKYSRGYHIDPYIGGTMAALYTRAADRRRLSIEAMSKLENVKRTSIVAPLYEVRHLVEKDK